jgi:hypothetical protein
MKSLKKTINIDMYGCKLELIVTKDIQAEVCRLLKKAGLPDEFDGGAEGMMLSFIMEYYYLIIDENYLTHNTLAHEIYHAVVRITEDRNITDEETQAWLAGHITEFVYKFIESKKLEVSHGK